MNESVVETPQEKKVRQYQMMVDTGCEPVDMYKQLLVAAKRKLEGV